METLVVCNGCSDDTAQIAAGFGRGVRVIETEVASKTRALNLGDAEAVGAVRVYLDADVVIDTESIRAIAKALTAPDVMAAAPVPINVFKDGGSWSVKAYYQFWMALPYIREGMITAGVYALNERGRARFGPFPDVIADDGYVRLLFANHERVEVAEATSLVFAPTTMLDLLKIKTRARLGMLQLRGLYPALFEREASSKRYAWALLGVAVRPSMFATILPYAYVTVLSWLGARHKMRRMARYVWERDDSSRVRAGGATK
jgi:glycosyltransferase involved in cell wall biosynthesis